jgi:6-phosphogluconate dehydrogenase
MGSNMALRLLRGKHAVIAFDREKRAVRGLARKGAVPARSLEELVKKLPSPRAIWLMLPAGPATDSTVEGLAALLSPGDMIVDGSNGRWTQDAPRAERLARCGIRCMDAGVSGGVWGLKNGYCLMLGGEKKDFRRIEPALKTLAPKDGYLLAGPAGAGHYSKMIHNGIEYGMMQSYAEGFSLLESSPLGLDLHALARLWNRGSVVRSWLLELVEHALAKDPSLSRLRACVSDSGEGRWTVQDAVEQGVAAPVIALSLFQRFSSREKNSFGDRLLAALRSEFGGHAVQKAASASRRRR